jgi:phage/plasmid primase-like uncharacterized protein
MKLWAETEATVTELEQGFGEIIMAAVNKGSLLPFILLGSDIWLL